MYTAKFISVKKIKDPSSEKILVSKLEGSLGSSLGFNCT
ncbi:MAG: hypothetical protein ACJAU2_001643 [Maribacter sp.]|jgi:hypothetical protein